MARYYSRDIICTGGTGGGGGGTGSWIPFGGGNSEVIATSSSYSGTYTVPSGATSIRVSCLGAGGNGAAGNGENDNASYGGGGGGFSQKTINNPSPTYTVVVNSAVTSFGNVCQATAGHAGGPAATGGCNGGVASGGDYNFDGGDGGRSTSNLESLMGGGGGGILTFLSTTHTTPAAMGDIGGGAEVIGYSPHDYTPISILDKNFYRSTTGGPLPSGYPGTGGDDGANGGFAAGGGGGPMGTFGPTGPSGDGGVSGGGGGGHYYEVSGLGNPGSGGPGMILVEW